MTVREEVRERIKRDALLAKLRKKIESGKGTYADTAAYSIRAGKLLGEIFSRRLPEIPLEEREPLCVNLLHDQYIDINLAVDTVQRFRDEAQGFHLAPQHAPFNSERASVIGNALVRDDFDEERHIRVARSATATATRAMHDDRMKAEAKFRSRAGLKCYITRETDGKCCGWCSKFAGRYEYGDEPKDIYRRHDNCGCSVTYENGRKRQDVWSKREWEAPERGAGAGDPIVLTKEQGTTVGAGEPVVLTPEQAEKKQAKYGLTFAKKSGTMRMKEWFAKNEPISAAKAVPALRKQSAPWVASLSPEEKRAITKYSKNPGDKGEEKFYHRLNAMLRGEIPVDTTLQYYADNITNALRIFKLQSSIICYRGVEDNPLKGLSVGDLYVPKQYLSTSVTPKGALNKNFKMMILTPAGADGAYIEMLSEYPNQREFLFNCSCRYVIVEQEDDYAILEVIV